MNLVKGETWCDFLLLKSKTALGSLSTAGGNRVDTRRFTATAPADGTAASVGPALNRAANQVALDVAKWIGG